MTLKHTDLYRKRKEEYRKGPEEESFLEQMNGALSAFEQSQYESREVEHPLLFVIGLPRSGTTLLSQLLAHSLDTGYVNNLAARYWKVPVTGIRFARAVLEERETGFSSRYGATEKLSDIHEFGYFWRDWLKKDSFENIKNARGMEEEIDWEGLKSTLANMQAQFGRPMVFKNIYGSYHIPRLNEVLGKTLWICIERDPLDSAVSILNARRKYYDDPDTWWSYLPPEYDQLIGRDYRYQIAGQIHFLRRFYRLEMDRAGSRGLTVSYRGLCESPASVLEMVRERLDELYGQPGDLRQEPPSSFEYRIHEDQEEEKSRFRKLLNEFEENA